MQTRKTLFLILACTALAAGCGSAYKTEADRFVCLSEGKGYDQGLVLCLGGAGGFMGEVGRISRGLREGGLPCAVEEFEWASGVVLFDQMALETNKDKAAMLTRRIVRYQREHPGRPVHLVAVSAGTGLAVWATEPLPPGHGVQNIFLIASSLWKHYDLAPALAKVDGRLYSYHSKTDGVLGLLVPIFGTVDRRNGAAGGLHGFCLPAGADDRTQSLYKARLQQVAWTSEHAAYGHIGGHLGGTSSAFVCEYIAPILRSGEERPTPQVAPETAMVLAFPPRN